MNRPTLTMLGGNSPAAVDALYRHLADILVTPTSPSTPTPPSKSTPTPPHPIILMLAPKQDPAAVLARITQPLHGIDVIIQTSGSTGDSHLVGLTLAALTASAHATHERLGGPGQWLTSLPIHHIAGFQVVLRSVLASHPPTLYTGDPNQLATTLAQMRTDLPRYMSVVPTQLHQIVATNPAPLATPTAILVGGAALPTALAARARAAGARIVTSYGMTETAGGCVYDGLPLRDVEIRIGPDGRIRIAGPVLASRYVDAPLPLLDDAASPTPWLLTADQGEWRDDRLHVTGRVDDVIISGGVNVAPGVVERELGEHLPGTWVVVGAPDERWGTLVVAVTDTGHNLEEVRAAAAALGEGHRPRAVVKLEMPFLPSGKVDRRTLAERARAVLAAGGGERRG